MGGNEKGNTCLSYIFFVCNLILHFKEISSALHTSNVEMQVPHYPKWKSILGAQCFCRNEETSPDESDEEEKLKNYVLCRVIANYLDMKLHCSTRSRMLHKELLKFSNK